MGVAGGVDGGQTHALADEALELVGVDLAETFEAGDFGVAAALGDGLEALGLGVAVERVGLLAGAADAE